MAIASSGMAIALPRWQRLAIYLSTALMFATGVVWLLAAWPPPDGASTPAARTVATWALRAHGVTAYALLVIGGSVLPVHVRLGWGRQRNRRSGTTMLVLLLVLAATGLWLYYGPELARETVSVLHWVIGLGLPAWLMLHRWWGLRSRRR